MTNFFQKGFISALMFAASAGMAMAGWGAVGIGPNGAYGWSADYGSESGAIGRVRAECPGCDNIKTFYNACGAMASGRNGAWGWGWAGSRWQAEQLAIQYCRDYGSNCQLRVWACSL